MKTRSLIALAAIFSTAACGDEGGTPGTGPGGRPPVVSVTVRAPELALLPGEWAQLTATVRGPGNAPLDDRAVAWSSSDERVATVSATGRVTAQGAGVAIVTAASEGQRGEARVEVGEPPVVNPVPVVEALSPARVAVGGPTLTLTLRGRGFVQNGRVQWGGVPRPTTWISATEVRAEIWPGDLEAAREVAVQYFNAGPGGGISNAASFWIVPQENPVASVDVRPAVAVTRVGGPVTLTATVRDASGTVLADRYVTYTSSDARVAQVNGNGLVTAVGAGEATITARSEGRSATSVVTVTPEAYDLVFDRGGPGLFWLDLRLGTPPTQIWNGGGGGGLLEPAPAPDRRRIAYTIEAFGHRQLAVFDMPTRTYTFVGVAGDQPAWSPAGSRIAYRSRAGGRGDVWTVNADGTGAVNLTASHAPGVAAAESEQPAWSPDGARIVFAARNSQGGTHLVTMKADGTDRQALTAAGAHADTEPVWYGDFVFFTRKTAAGSDVWRVRVGGGAPVKLTDSGKASMPAVSPEGKWIAYVEAGALPGTGDLWAIHFAAGGPARPLSLMADTPGGGGQNPAWVMRP
ncbi:MAG TPA: Ig-like domain-containing protein [Longimicrobium sp.]|nr:Ig-like domain-containing protein [Longimicrobium sp.]